MKSGVMCKQVTIFLIFFCIAFSLKSQRNSIPPADKWKGYERVFFMIDDHIGYYVKPVVPLEGNPWIWKASFPDWHTAMDSNLLVKGFYVAYINVDDQYGSPSAMMVWDRFYQYLVDTIALSAKVSLEAVSRGSMYAYGWAKRNPDKLCPFSKRSFSFHCNLLGRSHRGEIDFHRSCGRGQFWLP